MFFMTCGIIKQIQSRKSLFGQTSALPYFKSTNTYTSDMNNWFKIQLRHYEIPVILKIIDIQHFQNETDQKNDKIITEIMICSYEDNVLFCC